METAKASIASARAIIVIVIKPITAVF